MWEIIARVQLEDEYVVDADFPPAVGVEAETEDHEDDEEHPPVHPHGRHVVYFTLDEKAWKTTKTNEYLNPRW